MIVPSIDLMNGRAVQLVGGDETGSRLDGGDPRALAQRFGRLGEIAVIDLDAALGTGSNADVIRELVSIAPCRVGGGIRSVEAARDWLDAGAQKVILGTRAVPEVLSQLPRERVIAALDAIEGEVVVEGWKTRTGASIEAKMRELRPYVGGFLVTFVEREGRMQGTDLERVGALVEAAGDAELTIAGGVTTGAEIAELDALQADAQVGMALYTGKLPLAEAFAAPLVSDRSDGLWPTLVTDARGAALGLAYSNPESLAYAIEHGVGTYWSRKRGLWIKGQSSGNTQSLVRIDVDCDRDTLRFVVRQSGAGFCHLGSWGCFGEARGLTRLENTLHERRAQAPEGSYTRRLFDDAELLRSKLLEEAEELASAPTRDDVIHEAADVIYFAMVHMARAGVRLEEVEQMLDDRSLKVRRRKGDAKPPKNTP